MPTVFLSPSTQEYNAYYDGAGSEEYYMNRIADAMVPDLEASGITVLRNSTSDTAVTSAQKSNAGNAEFHLAIHSNAAPENLELAVNLFQLVDTSCRVVLLFCLEEVMVAVFLHALSVFIHAFPPVRMTSTKVDAGTGRKPCAMI